MTLAIAAHTRRSETSLCLLPLLALSVLCFLCCLDPVYAASSTTVGGAKDEKSIKLGMSAAFTGPSKGLGIELYRGSMAWFEHVNQRGGIHGRTIRIIAADDGYDPTPAIENTLHFEQQDVLALFNYVGTPTVARVLPLLKLYKNDNLFLFFPFTGAQPQRETPYLQHVFNLRASYRQETQGLVNNFVKVGRSRIAVFYQADAYGRSGWDGVRRGLDKYGLKLVGEATYSRGTLFSQSMQRQVEIIAESKPDAIISIGAYSACAAFIRDARDAGLDVPIANLSFVGSENLLNLLLQAGSNNGRDYTAGLINTQVVPSYEDMGLLAVREYREFMKNYSPAPPAKYARESYKSLQYSFVSFEGFLNAKVMTAVLERMGPAPERSKIEEAVLAIDNLDIGLNKPVRFSETRHQGLDVIYYTTVGRDAFMPLTDWSIFKK